MILDASCRIAFTSPAPAPAVFMLRPRSGWGQWVIGEKYSITPHAPVVEFTDLFGNLCQRVVVPEGRFEVEATCRVETADVIDVDAAAGFVPVQWVPESIIQFLLPSRYCESDALGPLALSIVGDAFPGYPQVETIRSWIRANVAYTPGASHASTSARETLDQRQGVCRDLTHTGIALCRALNIPARMVVGFLHELKPMDLHAWWEAYVGGRWFTFDALDEAPRGNRISIAYGRDAADVSLVTQFGPMNLETIEVAVRPA
jgi:transglutaminase-like putative cysteine protease